MSAAVKVDEDLPAEMAVVIAQAGHDAKTVHGQGLTGSPDAQLWPIIQQESRILITADKGFANAITYPPGTHAGIVLFRLPRESRAGYLRLAKYLVAQINLEDLSGSIAVVSPDSIRVLRT